jgi:class 3 adenylate cyclase
VPAQTRGFLFSDLRGYSAFVDRHGDRAARELLTRYRRVVRDVIGRFGGAEVRTEGDSFYIVFDSVSQAVEAGIAIQAALTGDSDGEPIRVGIGIHAGEVEDDVEQGIVSGAVNIAARICSVAEPGEVLVTETVHSLTRGYLDVAFVPRGRRRLKGIRNPVAVYRVGVEPAAGPRAWRGKVVRGPGPLAVGVALALVGVTTLGVAMRLSDSPGAAGDGQPESQAPRASLAASAVPASARESDSAVRSADAFPNSDETRLLALVDEPYRTFCDPAAPGSVPSMIQPAGTAWEFGSGEVPFAAGVTCEPFGITAPDEITLWLLVAAPQGTGSPTAWIVNRAAGRGVASGSCSADARALEAWSGGPQSGYLLCFSGSEAPAVVYWTYDGSALLGRATRTDGDLGSLVEWWTDEARLRRPPD